jgi:hypothetical protein
MRKVGASHMNTAGARRGRGAARRGFPIPWESGRGTTCTTYLVLWRSLDSCVPAAGRFALDLRLRLELFYRVRLYGFIYGFFIFTTLRVPDALRTT